MKMKIASVLGAALLLFGGYTTMGATTARNMALLLIAIMPVNTQFFNSK
jgi:hypothetical protein